MIRLTALRRDDMIVVDNVCNVRFVMCRVGCVDFKVVSCNWLTDDKINGLILFLWLYDLSC